MFFSGKLMKVQKTSQACHYDSDNQKALDHDLVSEVVAHTRVCFKTHFDISIHRSEQSIVDVGSKETANAFKVEATNEVRAYRIIGDLMQ